MKGPVILRAVLKGVWVVALWAIVASAFAYHVRVQGATVYVNEQLIVTLRGGRNNERAQVVGNSFRKLTNSSKLSLAKVDKYTFNIMDGERVVLTATRAEAKAQGMTPDVLAKAWLDRLQRAVTASPLGISTDKLVIPEGGSGTIKVFGWRSGEAKISLDSSQVASVARKGENLRITAKSLGEVIITLQVDDLIKTAKVSVLPAAAKFPQSFVVSVTGDPANADTVRSAVEGALWTRIQTLPTAQYTFKMPDIGSLGQDQSRSYTIPVRATSAEAFDAEGNVVVTVRNEPIGYRAESELWYCNHPENVEKPGNLFVGRLDTGKAVRMLYHHINQSPAGLIVQVNAINESDRPARVLLIPGDSKPDKNPVLAGLVAGDQLLRNWVRFSGEVVTIPPRSSIPVAMRRIAPQETMSGLCYLMLVDGPSNLSVRADAVPSFDGGGRMMAAIQTPFPWRRLAPAPLTTNLAELPLSPYVYPWPFKNENVDFSVGGRHGFIRIGQKPIAGATGGQLDGNFGVFYAIEANCENPGGEEAEVEVVFEASAGYSGALFIMNGEVLRTPLLQPKEEALITKFKLASGEKKKLQLMTVPLSGSSYPATIVIRPAGTGSGPKPRELVSGG